MSMFSDYKREESQRLEPGDYRVEITGVEKRESKAGNDMIVLKVKPNGSNIEINHYIVKNEYFNRNVTEFFDSFNVDDDDYEYLGWVGAVGAAKLVEDENGYLKVRRFIDKEKAKYLPVWQGKVPERQTISKLQDTTEEDGELPFGL